MTPEDLDRYETITNAATPGPWVNDGDIGRGSEIETADGRIVGTLHGSDNAAFVIVAREAMPALIARVRELESTIPIVENLLLGLAELGEPSEALRRMRESLSEKCPDFTARGWLVPETELQVSVRGHVK